MRVVLNQPETPTTRRLKLAMGESPLRFQAGQAASLRTRDTAEFTPYSIASSPQEADRTGEIEFLVKVDGANRFGSHVTSIAVGTAIEVDGPHGRFILPDGPRPPHLLFVAGGTGIAPLRAMIVAAQGRRPAARLGLLYSSRTPDEFAYPQDFVELERRGALVLRLTLTGAHDEWPHARGRAGAPHLTGLIEPDTVSYLCGPAAMVADVCATLQSLGMDRSRIRMEDW